MLRVNTLTLRHSEATGWDYWRPICHPCRHDSEIEIQAFLIAGYFFFEDLEAPVYIGHLQRISSASRTSVEG